MQSNDETLEKKPSNKIECKFCKSPIFLKRQKQLPKKLISEKYGICWTGLVKVYLLIYKIQCDSCKKKYSHKVFQSTFLYK